jgi:hypothetical protein
MELNANKTNQKGNQMKIVNVTSNCGGNHEFEVHGEGCRDLAKTKAQAGGLTWKVQVQNDLVEEVMADINEDFEEEEEFDASAVKFHACSKR